MAVAGTSSSSIVPSLPPPRPKSPPDYPDLYGKRRELAKVLMLEREIGFLQEELKYVEGLLPASRCIKEVADFVAANSDPLIPTSRKVRRSCRLWKWLCGKSCFNMSWICCFGARILKCQAAVTAAIYSAAIYGAAIVRVAIVEYLSVAASHAQACDVLRNYYAAEVAACVVVLVAQIALLANANANAHALVSSVQSYPDVLAVQLIVAILFAVYVSRTYTV